MLQVLKCCKLHLVLFWVVRPLECYKLFPTLATLERQSTSSTPTRYKYPFSNASYSLYIHHNLFVRFGFHFFAFLRSIYFIFLVFIHIVLVSTPFIAFPKKWFSSVVFIVFLDFCVFIFHCFWWRVIGFSWLLLKKNIF